VTGRLAGVSLRTRLTALVCAAIGIVALAAALSSYLLVSGQLNREVDAELAAQAAQALKFIQVGTGGGTGTLGTGPTAGAASGDGQLTVGITVLGGDPQGTATTRAPGAQPPPVPGSGSVSGSGLAGGTVVTTTNCVQDPAPSDNPVVRPAIGLQLVKQYGTRCATPY